MEGIRKRCVIFEATKFRFWYKWLDNLTREFKIFQLPSIFEINWNIRWKFPLKGNQFERIPFYAFLTNIFFSLHVQLTFTLRNFNCFDRFPKSLEKEYLTRYYFHSSKYLSSFLFFFLLNFLHKFLLNTFQTQGYVIHFSSSPILSYTSNENKK